MPTFNESDDAPEAEDEFEDFIESESEDEF